MHGGSLLWIAQMTAQQALWPPCAERIADANMTRCMRFDAARLPGARWFTGVKVNFAQNLLRFNDECVAFVARDETSTRKSWTLAELNQDVAALAQYLRSSDVVPRPWLLRLCPMLAKWSLRCWPAAHLARHFPVVRPILASATCWLALGKLRRKY